MKQRCSTFHENILLNCSTSCILNGAAPESVFKVARAMCWAQLLQRREHAICAPAGEGKSCTPLCSPPWFIHRTGVEMAKWTVKIYPKQFYGISRWHNVNNVNKETVEHCYLDGWIHGWTDDVNNSILGYYGDSQRDVAFNIKHLIQNLIS